MAERKIQRGKTSYWAYAMNWTILTLHAVHLQVAQWLKRRENRLKLKKEVTEQHKARASQVRARGHWVKKGEKNTKYFLTLKTQQQMLKSNTKRLNLSLTRKILWKCREITMLNHIERIFPMLIWRIKSIHFGETLGLPTCPKNRQPAVRVLFWEKKCFMHLNNWKMICYRNWWNHNRIY